MPKGDGEGCPQAGGGLCQPPPGAQLTRGGCTISALALRHLGAQERILFHPCYFLQPFLLFPQVHKWMQALGSEMMHLGDAGGFTWGRGEVLWGSQHCPSGDPGPSPGSSTPTHKLTPPSPNMWLHIPARPPKDAGTLVLWGCCGCGGGEGMQERLVGCERMQEPTGGGCRAVKGCRSDCGAVPKRALPSPLSQGMQCQAQPVLAKKPDNIPFEGRKPIWGGKTLPITDRTCTSEKLC